MAYAALNKTNQEPFTMMPNRYMDRIAPQLTDTQWAICDVVIRMTYGWHRSAAAISNATFMAMTGKSEPAIIRAKAALKTIGLLIVLKEGGGTSTGTYALDLYYDDPARSARASMQRKEQLCQEPPRPEQPTETPAPSDITTDTMCPQDMPQDTTKLTPANIQDVEMDTSTAEVSRTGAATPMGNIINGVMENIAVGRMAAAATLKIKKIKSVIPDNNSDGSETTVTSDQYSDQYAPDAPAPKIPDPASAPEPAATEAEDTTTPNAALAPSQAPDSNNIIYINKQATDASAENTNPEPVENGGARRKAVATVRFRFLKLFPEAGAEDDWPLFGWATKAYGMEACLEKLNYMREHRKQHAILNPKGFFRFALEKNYRPPKSIAEKLRADEKARRALDISRQESQRWEEHVRSFNYDAAQAALQKVMDSL